MSQKRYKEEALLKVREKLNQIKDQQSEIHGLLLALVTKVLLFNVKLPNYE